MPKNSGPRTLLKQIDLRNALKQSMFTGKMYIYIIQQYTVVHHLLCNTNQTVFSKGKVSKEILHPPLSRKLFRLHGYIQIPRCQ